MSKNRTNLKRRELLKLGGKVATVGAVAGLSQLFVGCGDNQLQAPTSSGNAFDEETGNNSGDYSEIGTTYDGWAADTTELISVDYPDDSIFEQSNSCSLAVTQQTTLGPCYFADSTGEDISLGLSGLPMQLCLRLVDSNCNPLTGYKIEIWHSDIRGVYSGDTSESSDASSFAGNFCTGGDSAAENSTWYRGLLSTDSNGRVNFKTHFPGWYSGRTIHIHFAVVDSYNNRQLISQLCFTDDFADYICTNHGLYSGRGVQDTPLARDNVFPSDYEDFVLSTEQNEDGTLLAYHTIKLV